MTVRIEEFEGTLAMDPGEVREMLDERLQGFLEQDESVYLNVEESMKARDVEVDLSRAQYHVEVTDFDETTDTISWRAYLEIQEPDPSEDYVSDTWSMFSAEGDAAIQQAIDFYQPLVENGSMHPENALRAVQDYAYQRGHREATDTAVREAVWGALGRLQVDG